MSRLPRALAPSIAGLLALVLAGCASGTAQPTTVPVTRPPTQPPVVTRIVPPPPTPTATPAPTLAFDMLDAAGGWMLRVTLDVTGSTFVERQSYFGAVSFEVDDRGTVSGSGYFTPMLDGGRCLAESLDNDPLTYRVEGEILPAEMIPRVNLRLVPDDRGRREAFRVTCPDTFGDVRERHEPYLWPVLSSLDLMTWPLALEEGRTYSFEADLSATATGFDGLLAGEVQVSRG